MSDKTRELLPCPFCGGNAKTAEGMGEYWVRCLDCSATSGMMTGENQAATEWNTRKAAKEKYGAREKEIEAAARVGFRAGWCYSGNDGTESAESFAKSYVEKSGDKQ